MFYIAEHEGEPCTKAQLAEALGRNKKTIDRLVAHLKEEGLVTSKAQWGMGGQQLANAYYLVRAKWK